MLKDNYKTYQLLDFLNDDYFISSLLYPTAESELYWKQLVEAKKINEKIRKDRYKYDEKGIPVFFEGTNIPRPRDRKVNEMDEEYANFLKEYYEDLEKRGVLNQLQPQNVSGEEKDGKQLPAVTKELPVPISKEKPVPPPPIRPLAKPPVDLEEGRNFDRIIAELKLGLKIDDKSGKRYTASNVKVIKRFKNELKEKEKIYNITNFLPAIGRVIIGTISKYWSKWQLKRTEQKHTMKVLEDRINNLPEADLMVIYEKYRPVILTAKGREVAECVLNRHKLLSFFLTRVLDIPNSEADEVACRMEHAIGGNIAFRLAMFMGDFEAKKR